MLSERKDLFDPKGLTTYAIKKRDARLAGWPRWVTVKGEKVPMFSCHDANACWRQLCFDFGGLKPNPMDWQGCLRVYDGEPHGDSLVHWLTELGYKVTDRERSFKKLFNTPDGRIAVRGRVDGIIEIDGEPCILEMKGLSTYTMRKSSDDIVNKTYRFQAQCYMWLSGIRKTIFVIKDKNNSQFRFFELEYNPKVIQTLKQKWLRIARAVRGEELLSREYAKDSLECSWCSFTDRCWRD